MRSLRRKLRRVRLAANPDRSRRSMEFPMAGRRSISGRRRCAFYEARSRRRKRFCGTGRSEFSRFRISPTGTFAIARSAGAIERDDNYRRRRFGDRGQASRRGGQDDFYFHRRRRFARATRRERTSRRGRIDGQMSDSERQSRNLAALPLSFRYGIPRLRSPRRPTLGMTGE